VIEWKKADGMEENAAKGAGKDIVGVLQVHRETRQTMHLVLENIEREGHF
jgi:hypothetical protein